MGGIVMLRCLIRGRKVSSRTISHTDLSMTFVVIC